MKPVLRKTVAAILMIFVFGTTIFAAQAKDVEANHWAYQSVKELLDKGYLSVYPDNTFRGNEPVDRYTLATVVARMLKEVQTGKVTASDSDIETLSKLYQEFQEDMVKAFADINKLDQRVTSLEKSLVANKDEITRLQIDYNNNFKPEMAKQIEAVFASMNTTKSQLESQISSLRNEIEILKGNVSGISEEKPSTSAVDLAISDAIQKSSSQIDSQLKSVDSKLNEEIIALRMDMQKEDQELQEELAALKTTLTGYIQSVVDLAEKTEHNQEALSKMVTESQKQTDAKLAQLQEQIDLLDLQLREDLQSTRSSSFVKERTIENRLQKMEDDLKSTQESTDARLTALENSRYFWWAGFGLSVFTIILAIISFN